MTRFPHDQFAKEYLKELLAPLGGVETSRDVVGEIRQIDVWFAPAPQRMGDAKVLGLLGRFASNPCLLEPFHNAALPGNHPLRSNILLLLTNLQANLQSSQNLDEEERELIMELSPLVLQWREEALREGEQRGEQRGIQQGQRIVVENLLRFRFGSLDEQLSAIIEPLLKLPPEEFTLLLLQLSREELLVRFGEQTL